MSKAAYTSTITCSDAIVKVVQVLLILCLRSASMIGPIDTFESFGFFVWRNEQQEA
jgi:hypothetical protein